MALFPIHLELAGRLCVIVGGGSVAERRAEALLECGARVLLIAPDATEGIGIRAASGDLVWLRTAYQSQHLEDCTLAIAATDDVAVNAQIAEECRKRRILVSRADSAAQGDFIVPAQVRRGALLIDVSTAGASPTLTSVVRERIAEQYGPGWEPLVALFGCIRDRLRALPTEELRQRATRTILEDEIVKNALSQGDTQRAEARALECL